MEENNKVNINKGKIITNTITATLTIVLSCILIVAIAIVAIPIIKDETSSIATSPEMANNIKRIQEAMNKIQKNYIDDVNADDIVDGAIAGMAAATGDPYTRYMSEEEYQEMMKSSNEEYCGIGVHITFDKDSSGIILLGIMPDSPAIKEGLKAGDIITKVSDKVVTKDNYSECVDALKGEEGSTVTLQIKRGEDLLNKTLTRKKMTANNIESEILQNNIGYIKIWSFDNNVYTQFKKEYENLLSKNITGLVIDVRNNPGGLVTDTVNIAKLLLPECDLLKLVYKDGAQKVYKCDGKNEIKIPLAVLVNSRSASASEILASAVKDSGKGCIIGNKTYGKGIVQVIEKLNDRGALSITSSKYYTASGIEIHKNGIEPNIIVDLPKDVENDNVIAREKDTQLKKAIEYINNKK